MLVDFRTKEDLVQEFGIHTLTHIKTKIKTLDSMQIVLGKRIHVTIHKDNRNEDIYVAWNGYAYSLDTLEEYSKQEVFNYAFKHKLL